MKGDLNTRSGNQVGIVKHWELDIQLVNTTQKRLLPLKGQTRGRKQGKRRERGGSNAGYREPSRGDSINYNYTIRSRFDSAEPGRSGRGLDTTIRYKSSIAGQRAFIHALACVHAREKLT